MFRRLSPSTYLPATLQVGSPSAIAERTGILTVGNFRVRDLEAGGQGAPLVSLAEHVLFRDPAGPIALNNLGSISNVTVVTPALEHTLAFDTGPANIGIDHYARRVPGNKSGFDEGGRISASGKVIPELLETLLRVPFFARRPPKAAGFAEFAPDWLDAVAATAAPGAQTVDLVHTAVEWTSATLADAYGTFVLPVFPSLSRAIFSGGGVHNKTLMARISERLGSLDVRVEALPREAGDSKEALAFALLANETLAGRPGNVTSVTGAAHACILGEIAP